MTDAETNRTNNRKELLMSDTTRVTIREVHDLLEKVNKRFDKLEDTLSRNYVPRSEYDKDLKRLDRDVREARETSDEQFRSLRQELHELYEDMKNYTAKLVVGITSLLTVLGAAIAYVLGG